MNPIYPRLSSLILLTLLGACAVVPQIKSNPNATLNCEICDQALQRPAAYRAFQGLDG